MTEQTIGICTECGHACDLQDVTEGHNVWRCGHCGAFIQCSKDDGSVVEKWQ